MRTRNRADLATNTTKIGTTRTVIGGITYQTANYFVSSPSSETCIDELHKYKRIRGGSKRWDRGGPLDIARSKVTRENSPFVSISRGSYRFDGSLACTYSLGANPNIGSYLQDTRSLKAIGTTGIARSRPGNPTIGIGQALAEARQLPTIPNLAKAVKSLSGLGSEYLNLQFGWAPLLRDIFDLLNYAETIDKTFKQLKRDNGKLIRRRCEVDKTDTTDVTFDAGIEGTYPSLHNLLYAEVPLAQRFKRRTFVKTGTRYWFEGAFRYWIPDIEEPWRARFVKAQLLDLLPTPSLVWNILPWSWLVDWFSNVGDIITNISGNAAANLVMPYGYAMGHKWTETSRYASTRLYNYGWVTASSHIRKDRKRRAKASPFGFEVELPDLSTRQLAILAALGLSRSKGLG